MDASTLEHNRPPAITRRWHLTEWFKHGPAHGSPDVWLSIASSF